MAKYKATINLLALTKLKKSIQNIDKFKQSEAKRVGDAALKEIKKLISRGKSPIAGPGISAAFKPYINPDKYPGTKKPHKPVNLTLTGKFLKNLKSKTIKQSGKFNIQIGYSNAKQKIKEKGHTDGAGGQPRRSTIPTASNGETWAPSVLTQILKTVRAIYKARK